MILDPNTLAHEISNKLAAVGENYTVKTVDLGDYGTSCEITKHDSNETLHITPVDDSLIDMVLYDKTGTTIASGTLFAKAIANITTEELTNLIADCF